MFVVVRSSIVVYEYVNNGFDIYCEFFCIICFEVNLDCFFIDVEGVVVCMIYVVVDLVIVDDIVFILVVVMVVCRVLGDGVLILCDFFMMVIGII